MVGDSLGLMDGIIEIKEIRNKTVHGGYVPSLNNGLSLLVLIRDVLKALIRIDAAWVTKLRSDYLQQQIPVCFYFSGRVRPHDTHADMRKR